MSSERTVWITGARGFLGRHVARALNARGHTVAGIGRGRWDEHETWGVRHWAQGNIDGEGLARLQDLSGSPAAVFHAAGTGTVGAAQEDPDRAFEDTVGTTQQLIDFISHHATGGLVIYPSSCAVYGDAASLPIGEDAPIVPASVYGEHKARAEEALLEAAERGSIRTAVVRFFSVYGSGLRKQVLWEVASRVASGETEIELGGTGEETRDFLNVDDATALIVGLMEREDLEAVVVNGGTGQPLSISQLVDIAQSELTVSFSVRFSGRGRPGDPRHYAADTARARSLGFTPRIAPAEGVAAYCRWIDHTLFGDRVNSS